MERFSHKRIVGQKIARLDGDTRAKALSEAVVRKVSRQSEPSYYEQVPDKYKEYIDWMAASNSIVTSFEELLDPDPAKTEEIARGWLIRQEVGPQLLKGEGFQDITELPYDPNQGDFNKSTFAGISSKGTLFILGRGGLVTEDRSGTAIVWDPLPERIWEEPHVPTTNRGARVIGKPTLDEPLRIHYNLDQGYLQEEEATPLVTLFKGPADADLSALEKRIKISNERIQELLERA